MHKSFYKYSHAFIINEDQTKCLVLIKTFYHWQADPHRLPARKPAPGIIAFRAVGQACSHAASEVSDPSKLMIFCPSS
jgi:hypothetical protein